jgi:putative tricarboxylic transport membrane protein
MTQSRRTVALGLAAFAALALAGPAHAWQPTEAVKIIVHTPPGSGSDIVARQIADIVEKNKLLSVPIEVINKTGGGGMNSMTFADQQKGNPHYILAVTNAFLSTPLRQKTALNYEAFVPIAILAEDSNAVQVNASSPYKTMADLVAAAKAKPKAIASGVGAIGATDHMLTHAIGKAAGVEFNVVSFDGGGDANTALLGNHVAFTTGGPSESRGQIDAGRIKVLAVVGDKRLGSMPDVPTLGELGIKPESTFAVIRGFVAPNGTPKEVADFYGALPAKVADTQQWKDFAKKSDFVDTRVGPVEMKAYLDKRNADIAKALTEMGVLKK